MKTQLLILACSSFILFGCNKNTASQNAKNSTETQAASETKAIDPDRQQLMDELAEYKDNPDIPPVQEKLARAYYQMLKTGGGDLEEIRGFISELQDTEQAAVEQALAALPLSVWLVIAGGMVVVLVVSVYTAFKLGRNRQTVSGSGTA